MMDKFWEKKMNFHAFESVSKCYGLLAFFGFLIIIHLPFVQFQWIRSLMKAETSFYQIYTTKRSKKKKFMVSHTKFYQVYFSCVFWLCIQTLISPPKHYFEVFVCIWICSHKYNLQNETLNSKIGWLGQCWQLFKQNIFCTVRTYPTVRSYPTLRYTFGHAKKTEGNHPLSSHFGRGESECFGGWVEEKLFSNCR